MTAKKEPVRRVRVLTKKREPREGICLLIENGRLCERKIAYRGLCQTHAAHLRSVGRIEEFALPRRKYRRSRIERKPHPEPGICRVSQDGAPCPAAAKGCGLCTRHYRLIWERSDLDLDDYCLPPLTERIAVKKRIIPGICRIREGEEDCGETIHARGLCARHYSYLATRPELFERFALPARRDIRYSRRIRAREGRCLAAENGQGCSGAATHRGLCRHHYNVLRKDPALMAKIALPARNVERTRFARADDVGVSPSQCVVLENEKRCTGPPFRRGVCKRHHTILGDHADYALNDFYTEAPEVELALKPPLDRTDGLCRVIEDGVACEKPPRTRGLCRRHYRRIAAENRLDEFALAPRTGRDARHGAANLLPHGYLDKNVLFDHADHEVFGAHGQNGSVALVERTRRGEFRASVSIDAVKSTYNHIRHRLQRPADEGGRGRSEADAEKRAHAYVRETFFAGGAWRLVVLAPPIVAEVVRRDDATLSLEDTLEFRAYETACEGNAAPTWFVTRDADFPEGVHPFHLARELDWI